MNACELEAFLARLYTDDGLLRAFLERPEAVTREAGLDPATARALVAIDREGLQLAAESYGKKRSAHRRADGAVRRKRWFFAG